MKSAARFQGLIRVHDFNKIHTVFQLRLGCCTEKILAEEDAVNPFTKNPLKVEDKNSYVKLFNAQAESTRIRKESQWHIKDTEWYTVHDIYKNENWSQLNK